MSEITLTRTTKETDITVSLSLYDENPVVMIDSGIGFFDHMLTAFSMHSKISLDLICKGDLNVDPHHTVEDCGIVLGQALKQSLENKAGLCRYGNAFIPMDETLALAVLDISSRPFLVFDCDFAFEKIGEMDTQLIEEFFRAFAFNAGITLHLKVLYGNNDHHKAEALFKACAHALNMALKINGDTILSTKGVI